MIIPDSFSSAYFRIATEWEPIKHEVDGIFRGLVTQIPSATYSSRIKAIESVFVKSQKGDYEFPLIQMEDFFACQLIIPSNHYFPQAITLISDAFYTEVVTTRLLLPSSFDYNDKHFKLSLMDSPLRQDKSVLNKPFELQVKTLLQYAWQQSSHDIIYKPKKISYWTERIASQLRAILELADDVLAQMESTAQVLHNQSVYEDDNYRKEHKQIIKILESFFDESELPSDRRRIAVVIKSYMEIAGVDTNGLEDLLKDRRENKDNVFSFLSLTVPDKVFVILYRNNKARIEGKFNSGKAKVLISQEMEDFFPELKQLSKNGRVKF